MKINGREVDVTLFSWSEPGGQLHIDILKLMTALGIPWSEAEERSVTREIMVALRQQAPSTIVHLVDREPPVKPRAN